jgi:hypothetical protein
MLNFILSFTSINLFNDAFEILEQIAWNASVISE